MNHIRPVFLTLAFAASMLFSASIAVTPATAAFITYYFSGQVNKVQGQLNPPFSVNLSPAAMSGSITVNTNDLNTNPNNRFGQYAITNFSLNVEGYTATNGTFKQVEIRNGTPGKDEFNVAVSALNGSFIGSRFPSLFEINLRGDENTFSSDALPTTVPSINSFSKKTWSLVFEPGGKAISGAVLAMTVVPLPAAVVLFGAGLVALVGLGAGSWRQKKNTLA